MGNSEYQERNNPAEYNSIARPYCMASGAVFSTVIHIFFKGYSHISSRLVLFVGAFKILKKRTTPKA
jgi:hypothetical protein